MSGENSHCNEENTVKIIRGGKEGKQGGKKWPTGGKNLIIHANFWVIVSVFLTHFPEVAQ